MTLLELLVKELPKRGGWPEDIWHVTQDSDGQVNGYGYSEPYLNIKFWNPEGFIRYLFGGERKPLSFNWASSVINREQYEAEIAAQQAAWNGDGLPPVGVECEYKWQNDRWRTGKVCYLSKHTLLMMEMFDGEESESAYGVDDVTFRPIRTEADRKRDEFVSLVMGWMDHATPAEIEFIYDKIAAGKTPGVELSK